MGVFTYSDESTSVIPPPRLFKALVLEADTLIPKIAPQSVKSAEIVEGDGGVGTIKKISFGEGSHYSYVKHRIDRLDKDNFVYNYSLVEGDALSDKIEKITYEIKLVASADGGSVIKSTSNQGQLPQLGIAVGKEWCDRWLVCDPMFEKCLRGREDVKALKRSGAKEKATAAVCSRLVLLR
ncbi:hypothetical protein ACE6H2_001212 [Prunus campanulata]